MTIEQLRADYDEGFAGKIVDYVRAHVMSTPNTIMFGMRPDCTIDEIDSILSILVSEDRLTVEGYEFRIPYTKHPRDCDFTIGKINFTDGIVRYGIIWYSGGESWSWHTYENALDNARRTGGDDYNN